MYMTFEFPGNGTNDNGQFGSERAVYEPSPFQLAKIGPGDAPVDVGLGDGVAVGVVWDGTLEPPPPEHPTTVTRMKTGSAIFLTPAKVI